MQVKDLEKLERCLHPEVEFIGPLATTQGKPPLLEAAKNFAHVFKSLTIVEAYTSDTNVSLLLEFECPEPIGKFRGASFLSFNAGQISRIELFYDPRPFVPQQKEIFNDQ